MKKKKRTDASVWDTNVKSKPPMGDTSPKHGAGGGTSNREWWPNKLKLDILRQHSSLSDPMEDDFNYA